MLRYTLKPTGALSPLTYSAAGGVSGQGWFWNPLSANNGTNSLPGDSVPVVPMLCLLPSC